MPTKIKRGFGWRPDKPDFRDYPFDTKLSAAHLPSSTDLRANCPPVLDQGNLGSCTANAIAEAIEFDRMKQGLVKWSPSRLQIYYNEREMEGTIKEDAGAEIRDGIKSVATLGAAAESYWPYLISKFKQKPPKRAVQAAIKHKTTIYKRLDMSGLTEGQLLQSLITCLASGYPFIFGFSVYESFESQEVANTGVVPMPSRSEGQIGGHAVLGVGSDDSKRVFLVQNSWGTIWGMKGYFTIPYDYVLNSDLAADIWQLTVTS